MSETLRDALTDAVIARLRAELPEVPVSRARRAPVDADTETGGLPLLNVALTSFEPDAEQELGRTHFAVEFVVAGYAAGRTDEEMDRAVSALHARTHDALDRWMPDVAGANWCAAAGVEFLAYDAEDSARPLGEFSARFRLMAFGAAGGAYTA
jgi:hypothetical protein